MADTEEPSGNIEAIKPPAQPPPTEPDDQTDLELERLDRQAKHPAFRAEVSHEAHIKTLEDHVDHHKSECKTHQETIADLRQHLDRGMEEIKKLSVANARLVEQSWAAKWSTVLGSIMITVGATSLGLAGLFESVKYVLGVSGAAVAICGSVVTVLSYKIGRRLRKAYRSARRDDGEKAEPDTK